MHLRWHRACIYEVHMATIRNRFQKSAPADLPTPYLPGRRRFLASGTQKTFSTPSERTMTILLCSTDEAFRRSTTRALEAEGHLVAPARNEQEASTILGNGGLSLVIVDLKELSFALRLLHAAQTSLPTIALTQPEAELMRLRTLV